MIWKDWLYLPIFGISIAGIFGFAYKKLIGGQQFWKVWFVLILILDTLSALDDYYSGLWDLAKVGLPVIMLSLTYAVVLPYYLALYFYGYKSDALWNPQPTPA